MVIVIGLKACEHFGAQAYVCEINMNIVSLVVILSTKIHKNRTPDNRLGRNKIPYIPCEIVLSGCKEFYSYLRD